MGRAVAGEHPLEALYHALMWQAAGAAAQSRITEAEQASYEHVVDALHDAIEHLSTACELPQHSPTELDRVAGAAGVVDRVAPEDFDHRN